MKTIKMRVMSKSGEYLGDVDTLSIWRGEVIHSKYDKWGCALSKPMISKFPQEVDIQVSINGEKWDEAQAPWIDQSAVNHLFEVSQHA